MSAAWLIAAVLLIGLAGMAVFDRRRGRREPVARDEPGTLGPMA